MEVVRGLHNGLTVPTLMYDSETWHWSGQQRSQVRAVEMRYFRVTVRDGLRNEEVYDRCGIRVSIEQKVKQSTLGWCGHMERMDEERMVARAYRS